MSAVIPVTFESLKYFIDSQLKVIEKPIPLSSRLRSKIRDRYSITETELNKVIRSLTAHLAKKYGSTFFTRQSKVEIIRQIISLEGRISLRQKKNLLDMNEILLVFNHDTLPDLNGRVNNEGIKEVEIIVLDDEEEEEESDREGAASDPSEDAYAANNVNLNGGLVSIRKQEILSLASELPASEKIGSNDIELRQRYDEVRDNVGRDTRKLREVQEKLREYKKLRRSIEFLSNVSEVKEGIMLNPSGEVAEQVTRMQYLAKRMMRKMQEEGVSEMKENMERSIQAGD